MILKAIPYPTPSRSGPATPPPSMRVSRAASDEDLLDEHLVHISLVLVDPASPQYKEVYNETKRWVL